MNINIVTANIRNNPDMLRRKVRADAKTTSRLGGVLFFQEIAEGEDHKDVKSAIGTDFTYVHDRVAIPIAFRTQDWTLARQGVTLAHRGRKLASPNRYISWVLLERYGQRVCFMNTHFVSGAWNRKHKFAKDWRKLMWQRHWTKMSELINSFHHEGVTVIFGGDFNRSVVPRFHRNQRWLVNQGIDKIGVLEGTVRVRRIGDGRNELRSDHDAWVARVELVGVVK